VDGRCTVSYGSNTQKTVLRSTRAVRSYVRASVSRINLLMKLCEKICEESCNHLDNKGANFLIHNSQVGPRTRHADIWHHWIRDLQRKGDIDVQFREAERMIEEIGSKHTDIKTFTKHAKAMREGLIE